MIKKIILCLLVFQMISFGVLADNFSSVNKNSIIKKIILKKREITRLDSNLQYMPGKIDKILEKYQGNLSSITKIKDTAQSKILTEDNDTTKLLLEYILFKMELFEANLTVKNDSSSDNARKSVEVIQQNKNKTKTPTGNSKQIVEKEVVEKEVVEKEVVEKEEMLVEGNNSCMLGTEQIQHGKGEYFYEKTTVEYGKSCKKELRTCDDGSLSGSYQFSSCNTDSAKSCNLYGNQIAHSGSIQLYSEDKVSYNRTCSEVEKTFTCDNGNFISDISNYSYDSCEMLEVPLISPTFLGLLKPTDINTGNDNSGNVIQGIARSSDGFWFTSQDAGNGYILFNKLDNDYNSLYDWQMSYDSHGDDLSVIKIDAHTYDLYVPHHEKKGIDVFRVNSESGYKELVHSYSFLSGDKNITSSLNQSKNKVVIRERQSSNSDTIRVYRLTNIENNSPVIETEFTIDRGLDNGWFQGIEYVGDKIYMITGTSNIYTEKYLYVYNDQGVEIIKKEISLDLQTIESQGSKYEPEALEYYDGDLYFTIMTGVTGNNTKSFYKVSINNLMK